MWHHDRLRFKAARVFLKQSLQPIVEKYCDM
jgi:hypothetical protein